MGKQFQPSVRRALTAVVLVLAALGLSPVPLASAGVTPTLTVSQNPAIHGEVIDLVGALPGPARQVKVKRRIDAGKWTAVSSGKTAKGKFHLQAAAPAAPASIVTYRVVAARFTVRGKTYPATQTPAVEISLTDQYRSIEAPARLTSGTGYTVSASFFPARPGRTVVLKQRTGSTWTKVGSPVPMNKTGVANFVRPPRASGDVAYRAFAPPFHKARGVKTDVRFVHIVGPDEDVTPPSSPADFSAILRSGVRATWSAVSAVDLAGYHVYRAETEHGPWLRQTTNGPQATTEYLDQKTGGRTNYWYAVTSVDNSGNESQRSAPARQPSDSDVTPPATPTGLTATPGDGQVDLAWDAITATDLAGYHVERRTGTDAWTRLTTAPVSGTSWTDSGAVNDTTYSYRVRAVDTAGNKSAASATDEARPTDTTAAAAPTGLTATAGDGKVGLAWDAVTATDLAGYYVERRTGTDAWARITTDAVTTSTWTDNTAVNDTTYSYRVVAVDTHHNESDPSTIADATPTDLTAPAAPTGLTATRGDSKVTLDWNDVTAGDLDGYQVERATTTGTWARITTDPVTTSTWTDNTAVNDTTYSYRVVAVDTHHNPSTASDTADATPTDLTAPATPTGLTATRGDSRVDLTWDAVNAADLAGYHVERTTAFGPVNWIRLTNTALTQSSYVDTGVVNDTTYSYRVVAIDTHHNASTASDTTTATPTDLTPPAAPTGLTATAGDSKVDLTWNAVAAGDLAGYHVERTTTSGPVNWIRVTSSPRAGTSYTDTSVANGTPYSYRVVAVDTHANASGPSVVANATPRDTTPPTVPTGLKAKPWNSLVHLTWDAVSSDDLAGYRVLVADAPAGPWQPIGETAATANQFTVTDLANDADYWFSVSAVDAVGNVSERGVAATATPTLSDVVVDAGGQHSCRIRQDATLWCWGHNGAGQVGDGTTANTRSRPTQVGTDANWAFVTAGSRHTCAIRLDRTLWCWGGNSYGQLGDGTTDERRTPTQIGTARWRRVSAGGDDTCATQIDGTLWCWGSNYSGKLGDGTTADRHAPVQVGTATWVTVDAGNGHTCAVKRDRTLWCWGYNFYGQVGDASTTDRLTPSQVGSATTWTDVSAGQAHTCGTRSDGTAWCWGHSILGQLGNGTAGQPQTTPSQVTGGAIWASITAGGGFTCGIRTNGTLWCTGINTYGALGIGSTTLSTGTPTQVGTAADWTSVTAGSSHACGGRGDAVSCWGSFDSGQVGHGRNGYEQSPTQVGDRTDWVTATSGYSYTCGIRTDGSLWCWGIQNGGNLTSSYIPTRIGTETDWQAVSSGGGSHTCGLRANGTLWCWGANYFGQLGDGTTTARDRPVQVGTASDWASISVGDSHTCAIRTDGTLWCWGYNAYGQLGDGSTAYRTTPTQIGTGSWATVNAGSLATCGLRIDETLWCWGYNFNGQVGDGTTTDRTTPTQIGTDSWSTINVGSSSTCGTHTDKTLWCWGYNASGQLGDGTTISRPSPTQIGTGTWATVSAGGSDTCGISTDGTLWCWGYNGYGQLGDGTTTNRTTPTRVGTAQWTTVATSTYNTCGTRSEGTLWCWGYNSMGQLGFRSIVTAPVAILE